MGPASTCTQCTYDLRAFSGVHRKTRDSPVVLGSLLPLLTVIRKKLLYSAEQDENRHVLDRNTLIFFLSPSSLTLSATVTQLNNVLGYRSMGFENLYLLCETELAPALLLYSAAVINFACGERGERCLASQPRQAACCAKRGRPGLLLKSTTVVLRLLGGGRRHFCGRLLVCGERSDHVQSVQHSGAGGASQSLVWYSKQQALMH